MNACKFRNDVYPLPTNEYIVIHLTKCIGKCLWNHFINFHPLKHQFQYLSNIRGYCHFSSVVYSASFHRDLRAHNLLCVSSLQIISQIQIRYINYILWRLTLSHCCKCKSDGLLFVRSMYFFGIGSHIFRIDINSYTALNINPTKGIIYDEM